MVMVSKQSFGKETRFYSHDRYALTETARVSGQLLRARGSLPTQKWKVRPGTCGMTYGLAGEQGGIKETTLLFAADLFH